MISSPPDPYAARSPQRVDGDIEQGGPPIGNKHLEEFIARPEQDRDKQSQAGERRARV